MTLAEEGNRLRLEIVRLGDPAVRRYTEELRKRVLDWSARAKQSGMKERECAELLDIPRQRLIAWRSDRAWRGRRSPVEMKALVPVEVHEGRTGAPFGPLAFVSPSGHRVEGLTIAEAIALLRAFT
jgi:hypothetical protein